MSRTERPEAAGRRTNQPRRTERPEAAGRRTNQPRRTERPEAAGTPRDTLEGILDLIDARLAEFDALEAAPDEDRLPAAIELPADVAASPDDLPRAEDILAQLREAEARIVGLRRRIAGEIAGLKRPSRAPRYTAPRLVDTQA